MTWFLCIHLIEKTILVNRNLHTNHCSLESPVLAINSELDGIIAGTIYKEG